MTRASIPPAEVPVAEGTDPLSEAEGLRSVLQEALTRLNRLLATMKQFRRQRRMVESAVASLKQINLVP